MGIRPLILLLMQILPLAAQTVAAIEGTIFDPSGAPVADASLRAIQTSTLAARSFASDSQGRYLIASLAPGTYTLEVLAKGFRPIRQEGLELSAGYSARIDFNLVLGASQETIEVRADPPLLSASAADWGGTLRRDTLQSLPLNGRDIWDLMTQQPGVVAPANASRGALSYGIGQRVAINGLRPKQNGFRLDGVQVNDATNNAPASAAGRSRPALRAARSAWRASPRSPSLPARSPPNMDGRRAA
ncbi:MAG: carboxypeptidase regulatory-like domain-containing protein [Acidobacteria bacterium]|nr:carboxypeptidase regulatory-like domain-containing protein [Acidobacteriota bacterium]